MINRLFIAESEKVDYQSFSRNGALMAAGAKSTMASAVADGIRRRIVSGELEPEKRLRVQQLAATFGVALSPVREALNRLTSEGLVLLRDMRGFSVAPVSEEELAEISRTRVWLNELALRESIRHGDDAWLESVLLAHHRLHQQPRMGPGGTPNPAWDEAHRSFHAALTSACRSRQLIAYCDQLFVMADRYRYIARGSPKSSSKDRDMEHQLIARAVIARRADEAAALLSKHFETTASLCRNVFRRSKTAVGAKKP